METGEEAVDTLRGEVESYVRQQVALGDLPYATIVEETVYHLGDEADRDVVVPLAREVAARELTAHLAAQAQWPEVTDNDRLTLAFRALDIAGIVARENFACCQNCGLGEIGDEVADGDQPRGYTFYHQQDAERGAEGAGLYLGYGLFNQPPSVEIGEEVAAALRDHDVPVKWDGSTGSRIFVPLTWRRRRYGRFAALPSTVDDDVPVEVAVLDAWRGPFALTDDTVPASWLTGLHLPWLPAGIRVRLTIDGVSTTVRRDWDTLVADGPDGTEIRVGRRDGMALVRLLRTAATSGPQPRAEAVPEPEPEVGLVEATWEHRAGGQFRAIPLEAAEAVAALRRMPVRTGAWACFVGRSGRVVQVRWEQGRLWLETPDPQTQTSVGRHVSLPEAERMVSTLAVEDRVAVNELGDLTTVRWG
ncbi:DUF6891 domain-containing protein [Plantactinospora sonchi]|uniref:DUF6891 domain-containing protein n=1 Tax=Plantactinospora sonchi TaxID=1544735 RepID=A0ABU7RWV8_9ACTN